MNASMNLYQINKVPILRDKTDDLIISIVNLKELHGPLEGMSFNTLVNLISMR